MLLSLRSPPSASDLAVLERTARERGYEPRFLDSRRLVVELERKSGRPQPGDRVAFEDLAFVASVLDASDAPELTERTPGREDTIQRAGDAAFGGPYVSLIAGPCAVEDEERLLEIALAVRAGRAPRSRRRGPRRRRRAPGARAPRARSPGTSTARCAA